MAFGFKLKKLETRNAYSIEELYEVIKDRPFSAGRPELVKHGFTPLIVFPPLDRNNQVRIGQGSMGKGPFTRFQITKGEVVGLANMAKNTALYEVTGGWSGFTGTFGKKSKSAEELVVTTYEELQALGL